MIREGGDIFTVPDGAKALWWEPVGSVSAETAAAPASEPAARGRGRPPKDATVQAPVAAPFAPAPEPEAVANEKAAAGLGPAPDWLPAQPEDI